MAIIQLFSGNTVPGEIIELDDSTPADGIYFIVNESLGELDVYPWGVFLMQVFVPFPVAKFSTVYSLDLFTHSYALFEPYPRLTGVNVVIRFYTGARSKVYPISLYQEVA